MAESAGFVPPPYPYDRLDRLMPIAQAHDGGVVELSIGHRIRCHLSVDQLARSAGVD